MEFALIILSMLALIQFMVGGGIIYDKLLIIKKLKSEISSLKEKNDSYGRILPGEKVTFPMTLTFNDDAQFNVI